MIIGAHSIIYTTDAEADRNFFRDVLGFPHVDVHDGWLIFAMPPSEAAFHPSERNDVHEFYLMVESITAFVAKMAEHGVATTEPQNQGWGTITQITLPGGGKLGVYEPHHARPEPTGTVTVN